MMGQLPPAQNALFYDFNLERHIPSDHLLRRIDQFLDFNTIRQHLKTYYSPIGRPSVDPELMIRMLLVGYCYGIHSERRLCEEVSMNLAYRWFCQLGLEDAVPDHSTFSKNRLGRFRSSDLLRMLFDTVVSRCIEEALVKGEGFAIDASLVRADVARQRAEPGPVDWTPAKVQSRPVKEYLALLDQEADLKRPQKSVSLTDPMAQWSSAQGRAQFFYSTNYLIDTAHGVIMDVEASPSTLSLEVATTRTMIERVESTHTIKPQRLMGDTAYGAAKNIGYLIEEKNIEPHVPIQDKSKGMKNTFSIDEFEWDAEADQYRCPANRTLGRNLRKFTVPRTGITKADTVIYRAHQFDCKVCPLKPQCCPNTTHRKIARSIHEEARDKVRAINDTDEYLTKEGLIYSRRQQILAHFVEA